jgi:DNA-binding transcriptional MerR regulator
MTEKIYTTAEVCEMLDLSKSTLFRWEREGILPPVPRDITGQRRYGQEHLRLINEKQRESLGRRYEQIAEKNNDPANFWAIHEAQAVRELIEGDLTGLYDLHENPQLSAKTIRQLLQIALDRYQPNESAFSEIIEVIWKHLHPDSTG